MPGMWQKTMVYLGLKDDEEGYEYDYDELSLDEEPGDAYERYDAAGAARAPGADRAAARAGRGRGATAGARRPGRRGTARAISATPTIRPMAAPPSGARVHVVEPHGFNDAQEVGDRLKADQPVIINLQGLSRDLQRRMIDFSQRSHLRRRRKHVPRRRPGVPPHAEQRRGLPRGEGAPAGPRAVSRLTRCHRG